MNWIKSHKLIVGLLFIIGFLLYQGNLQSFLPSGGQISLPPATNTAPRGGPATAEFVPSPAKSEVTPTTQDSRLVARESTLSLVVADVIKTGDKIVIFAKEDGGYMVQTSYSRPDQSPFATISVRVPAEKLDEVLSFIRSLGQKIISENIKGVDVTEDYVDIKSRLDTLTKAQAKLQEILGRATSPTDVLEVQKALLNIQQQMDSLTGQKQALAESARLTKISIYLSTDELALPYTPDTVFRPNVVFKQAVRSFLNTIRVLGELLIWVVVYLPLIIVVIVIYRLYKRWRNSKKKGSE